MREWPSSWLWSKANRPITSPHPLCHPAQGPAARRRAWETGSFCHLSRLETLHLQHYLWGKKWRIRTLLSQNNKFLKTWEHLVLLYGYNLIQIRWNSTIIQFEANSGFVHSWFILELSRDLITEKFKEFLCALSPSQGHPKAWFERLWYSEVALLRHAPRHPTPSSPGTIKSGPI